MPEVYAERFMKCVLITYAFQPVPSMYNMPNYEVIGDIMRKNDVDYQLLYKILNFQCLNESTSVSTTQLSNVSRNDTAGTLNASDVTNSLSNDSVNDQPTSNDDPIHDQSPSNQNGDSDVSMSC